MKKSLDKKIRKYGYCALLNKYNLPDFVTMRDTVMYVAWHILAGISPVTKKIRIDGFRVYAAEDQIEVIHKENLSYTILYDKERTKAGASPILSRESDVVFGPLEKPAFDKEKVMRLVETYDVIAEEIKTIATEVASEFAKDYKCHLIRAASAESLIGDLVRGFRYVRYDFIGHEKSRIVIEPNRYWARPVYYYDFTDPDDQGLKKALSKLGKQWHRQPYPGGQIRPSE